MQLPTDSIGPTDLIAYRECPRRFSYGMRRHVGVGAQSDAQTPESASYATHYGSAVHLVLHHVADGYADEDAIQKAWDEYGDLLHPTDLDLLRADIDTYRLRDFPNTRILLNEDELRIPLFVYEGRQIWIRTRVDRLYERIDAPGTFIHVDWKSSKWAKSEAEVLNDLQLWITNYVIHEFYPECDRLLQVYDQLRYGQIPVGKSAEERRQIREWLIVQITSVLRDEDVREDGLLRPRKNQWCAWCPVMESCPVIDELTEFALVEIATLAPAEKIGRRIVLDLDERKPGEYAARLEEVKEAMKILKRYDDQVGALIKHADPDTRAELGWRVYNRSATDFPPDAAAAIHDKLGDEDFYGLVKITKTGLEAALKDDPGTLDWALGLGQKRDGVDVLTRV